MKQSDDWGALTGAWQRGEPAATTPTLDTLQARDRRSRRRARWIRAGVTVLSGLVVIQGVRILQIHPTTTGVALVVPGWIASGVLWWAAVLATTRPEPRGVPSLSFLAEAALALERQLRVTGALLALVVVEAVLMLVWAGARLLERRGAGPAPDLARWGLAGLAAILLLAWAVHRRRLLRRERAELEQLRADLARPD